MILLLVYGYIKYLINTAINPIDRKANPIKNNIMFDFVFLSFKKKRLSLCRNLSANLSAMLPITNIIQNINAKYSLIKYD